MPKPGKIEGLRPRRVRSLNTLAPEVSKYDDEFLQKRAVARDKMKAARAREAKAREARKEREAARDAKAAAKAARPVRVVQPPAPDERTRWDDEAPDANAPAQPSLEDRIEYFSALALTDVDIAFMAGLTVADVERDFTAAVSRGRAKGRFKIRKTLFSIACDRKHPKCVQAAQIFLDEQDAGGAAETGASTAHYTDPEVAERFEMTIAGLRNR